MIRSTRTLAALAAAAVLTTAAASPASAARWSHDDARGDVLAVTESADGSQASADPVVAPEVTTTDITRVVVRHQARRLVLETELVDIAAVSGLLVQHLRTDAGAYGLTLRLGRDRTFPAFDLRRRGRSSPVRCEGLERTVDRAADLATVSIPRHCLDHPETVRVGTGAMDFDFTGSSVSTSADDALRDAVVRDRLRMSPPVARG